MSRLRCAVYTRKSSEEGLDQEFNSLDAQREACAAYIASQASLGWRALPQHYDDGGISGGTMQRPGLQALLSDIKAGRIDVVVVYKIDRLTRSLTDFGRMVEIFDQHDVSFVSITQQFNTTTSMGRLTLNVLLSFAQFEREVTAERIRDKIAASKRKGMWMGGPVPLGYSLKDRKLLVHEEEAKTVRELFSRFLELGSVRTLKDWADVHGLRTKHRLLKDGQTQGGTPFSRGHLYRLLSNPIYVGKITHKGEVHQGQHDSIIDEGLWQRCQDCLAARAPDRSSSTNVGGRFLLTGLIYDETGDRLSPSHVTKKHRSSQGRSRYRYYISHRLMQSHRKDPQAWRLPADELERAVLGALDDTLQRETNLLDWIGTDAESQRTSLMKISHLRQQIRSGNSSDQRTLLKQLIHRVTLSPGIISLEISGQSLGTLSANAVYRIERPLKIRRRGMEAKLVIGDRSPPPDRRDRAMVELLAKAHLWRDEFLSGRSTTISDLAKRHKADPTDISRILPLAWLAPDITDQILAGTQPPTLTIMKLKRLAALPSCWTEQRRLFGFAEH
ncbi:DNA invertase Pin-like site-specific DNA recombinase [Rhodoligotrophos appendicifer]|uniref:recombinase family protein n=1 Tax=Rhodoligotrophos appendicifer TaxID=987056 RepID=UPI0011860A1B|nr:recombinase family protein [Rhodoligotrophos appendicifer]